MAALGDALPSDWQIASEFMRRECQRIIFGEPRYTLGGGGGSGNRWTYKPLVRLRALGREVVVELRWRRT